MSAALKMNPKNTWLYSVLLLTLGLTLWTALQGDRTPVSSEVVVAKRSDTTQLHSSASTTAQTQETSSQDVEHDAQPQAIRPPKRVAMRQPVPDLFKPHSWYVPPPPPKKVVVAPPPPAAPPLPYVYNGKLEGAPQGTLYFLLANNRLYIVKKGESIDSIWRLDADNNNMLSFTYLPLNLPQTLVKGAAQAPSAGSAALAAQNN